MNLSFEFVACPNVYSYAHMYVYLKYVVRMCRAHTLKNYIAIFNMLYIQMYVYSARIYANFKILCIY